MNDSFNIGDDYDKIDAERKQAIERNIQLASEKAVLENELGHIEVQVKLLTEKLENNQIFFESVKKVEMKTDLYNTVDTLINF